MTASRWSNAVAARGGTAHIPTQSRVRLQRSVPPDPYRRRNLIERFFCKLKQFRRIATRFVSVRWGSRVAYLDGV
ncbi:hypothetical protein [Pseudogemmobacter blasticus]|uniref:hypothetical protein n=1 Tax=Fuscovulum blasticum TaxID=1075 RepID=UPI001F38E9B6|nr:hypothetical protein [Fuscovulum blasticum]